MTAFRRRGWLRSLTCGALVLSLLLLMVAPALAQAGGAVGPAAYVGSASVASFIRAWRSALAGGPWEELFDRDSSGTRGINDARLLLEAYLQSQWTPDRDALITAIAPGGQGCAGVICRGDGIAWSKTGKVSVPPGARELVVGSSLDLPNSQLHGAQIRLTSPDGLRSLTLGDGTVAASGLAQRSPAAPATDAALYNHFVQTTQRLPAAPSDADWELLLNAMLYGDPDLPVLPDSFWTAVDAAMADIDSATNALLTDGSALSPQVGLIIQGPQAGDWTIEVTKGSSSGSFVATAWVIPSGSDTCSLTQVAEALAGATASPGVRPQMDWCTGCDPGCEGDFQAWKNPDKYSAQWWYLKTWGTVISVLTWWLLRGSFTKAIDFLLDHYTGMLRLAPWIGAIIAKDDYKTGCIYLISRVYALILKSWPKAEALILRFLYCTGFDPRLKWGTRWNQICYIGLSMPGVPIWMAGVVWDGPFVIENGQRKLMLMIGANPLRMSILPDHWGQQEVGDTVKSASWEVKADGLLLLDPRATSNSQCMIECPEDPIDDEGTMTLTIANQPAKGEFPVKIEEPCDEPGPGFIVYTPHRTGEYAVWGALSYSELVEPETWAEADAIAANPGAYGYTFLGASDCSAAFPEGYFRYLIKPTTDRPVKIDALHRSSLGWYWSAYYWADEEWKLYLITHYSKLGTPGWRAVTGARDRNACEYAPGGYLNLLGQCWCYGVDGPCECQD